MLSHCRDLFHEFFARHLTSFHARKFPFPFTGQFGCGQLADAQTIEECHQRKCLGGWLQFAAFTKKVLFGEQVFYDLARVAGVPRPRPAIAARNSSSSMALPALSMAVNKLASE
jgi:hypothetical protein